jgi:hypothetical protein
LPGLRDDTRVVTVRVAGPAALLVSKLHKIADREGQADRLGDKDALDVSRLLQAVGTRELAGSIRRLLNAGVSRAVTEEAIDLLRRQFGTLDGPGAAMAARATEGLEDPDRIRASCVALSTDLLNEVGAR